MLLQVDAQRSAEHGWICRSGSGQDECNLPEKLPSTVIAEQKTEIGGSQEYRGPGLLDYSLTKQYTGQRARKKRVKYSVNYCTGSYHFWL